MSDVNVVRNGDVDLRVVLLADGEPDIVLPRGANVRTVPRFLTPGELEDGHFVISELPPGAVVTLVGDLLGDPRWLRVRLFAGVEGWIRSSCVPLAALAQIKMEQANQGDAAMQMPSVGMIVHYRVGSFSHADAGARVDDSGMAPAIVTRVWTPRCVDLAVFFAGEHAVNVRGSCELGSHWSRPPSVVAVPEKMSLAENTFEAPTVLGEGLRNNLVNLRGDGGVADSIIPAPGDTGAAGEERAESDIKQEV